MTPGAAFSRTSVAATIRMKTGMRGAIAEDFIAIPSRVNHRGLFRIGKSFFNVDTDLIFPFGILNPIYGPVTELSFFFDVSAALSDGGQQTESVGCSARS